MTARAGELGFAGIRRGAAAALVLAVALLAGAPRLGSQGPPPLTIERITSTPSLSGTPPSGVVWSPDGTRVAFLWNDQALPFRDVWVAAAAGGPPTRVTRFADEQPARAAETDLSLAALTQQAQARARGGVSELVWTPDGASIVFSYQGDLHRVPAGGGTVERLTRNGGGKSRLTYAPDGTMLAFLQGGDLWFWRVQPKDLLRATRVGVPPINAVAIPGASFFNEDVEIDSFAWAPDSKRLALRYVDRRQVRRVPFPYYLSEETSMNEARRGYPGDTDEIRALAFYTLTDGVPRLVDLPERTTRNILGYKWSPDGTQVLVEVDSDDAVNRWLYLVNPADRTFKPLLHDHRDRRLYTVFTSAWRSDGQAVIFIDDNGGYYRLASVPVTGGPATMLTTGAFDVADSRGATPLVVSAKTREIFFVSSQKSPYERHVYRMPERGGPIVQVTTTEGMHTPYVSPDASRVAVLHTNDLTPTELYFVDAKGGAPERRVTQSPPKEFTAYQWAKPRYVTFKSRIDNFTLHGRLMEPVGLDKTKKHPVIIGSVYSNTVRNEWRGVNQMLHQLMARERGYLTLQVDLRGSVGYGVDFRETYQGDWGGGDLEDLHSAVDYLKTLPYVDPDRIGIWGSSYGGMMVLFALFEKPGMFRAGVAGAPAISVAHFTSGDQHLSRRPSSHPEIFSKSTLLNYGEKLQDPLLIIQGMQDDIVPFKTTVMMMEKLMLLGKDFDMAFAPASAHGWTGREHYARFMLRKLLQHFDRHLAPGPRPPTTSAAR